MSSLLGGIFIESSGSDRAEKGDGETDLERADATISRLHGGTEMKVTIPDLIDMKRQGRKIVKVNLYDYPTAVLADRVGVDIVMIGDSVGPVMLGYESTLPVTMEEVIHHSKAVSRGVKNALVVADMPFISYSVSVEEAVRNAGRLVKEGGADAVKLEGGAEITEIVKAIVKAGIPVMGHIGLTPQRASQIGGYKVQGKDASTAKQMVEDALALQEACTFCIVLENTTVEAAKIITEKLRIPTLSAGAGPFCDGQSLNLYDMVGLSLNLVPKFAKQYADVRTTILEALKSFKEEVQTGKFPTDEHVFHMDEGEQKKLIEMIGREAM